MDAETRARLKADFANENATKVSTPRMDPETAARLKLEHSRRQKYLDETGGFGGGVQRAADAFIGALGDTGIGVAQALGQADPAAVKRMQARRDIDTSTNAGQFGNIVGSTVLPTIVSGGVTGALRALPLLRNAYATRNAIGSGIGGAVIPTGEGESNARNALISAGIGAGPAVARRLFAQPIKPTASAQTLIDEGIYPTPGQAHGGWLNRLEAANTSNSVFGPAVSEARVQPFKEYVARRQKAFGYEGNKLGREATEEMGDISDANYQRVIPQLSLDDTPALRAKYLRAGQNQNLTGKEARTFALDTGDRGRFSDISARSKPAGYLSGEDLNEWQSYLGQQGRDFSNAKLDTYQKKLGKAYTQAREDTLDELMTQGNIPTNAAQDFADARKYYAGMKNLMELGETGSAASRGGLFTPKEDLRWMRNSQPSSSNAFGRNAIEDQRLAQAGQDTLEGIPDSGTAGRLAMLSMMKNPEMSWPEAIAGLALSPGKYQPVRKFAVGAYGPQRALSKILRESEGLAMPTVAPYLTETYNESQR